MCRACHEVYRRLDKLREKANRASGGSGQEAAWGSSSILSSSKSLQVPSKGRELLADIDAAAASRRRAAAAEAGAATLSAEVAEMLRSVDARAGKLGIEAGILWRRRLRCVAFLCHGRRNDTLTRIVLLVFLLLFPGDVAVDGGDFVSF